MDESEWKRYRQKHIKHLEDSDITSADKYAQKFSDKSIEGKGMVEVREALKEMTSNGAEGLRGFYRTYPRADQDIMVINLNPKLEVATDFREEDNFLLSITDKRKYREAISVAGAVSWFSEDDYFWPWFQAIDSLPGVSTPWNSQSSVQSVANWVLTDRLQSVYYTNWYKMATTGQNEFKDFYDVGLAKETLEKEIESVDPDVIISFGGEPWSHMFTGRVESENSYDVSGTESSLYKTHGTPFWMQEHDTWVVPLYHPTVWPSRAFIHADNVDDAYQEDEQRREQFAELS